MRITIAVAALVASANAFGIANNNLVSARTGFSHRYVYL